MGVDLEVLTETDETTESDEPIFTHVIERDPNRTAEAIILEARIYGLTVTALCGKKFVPSRNPENHPPCERCLEILAFAQDLRS